VALTVFVLVFLACLHACFWVAFCLFICAIRPMCHDIPPVSPISRLPCVLCFGLLLSRLFLDQAIRKQLVEVCERMGVAMESCGSATEPIIKAIVAGFFLNLARKLPTPDGAFARRSTSHVGAQYMHTQCDCAAVLLVALCFAASSSPLFVNPTPSHALLLLLLG